MMRFTAGAMALALLVCGAARAEPGAAPHTLIDRIVAVVDGEPILLSTLRRRAAPYLHRSSGVPGFRRQQTLRRLYRTLMKRLVEERLVARAARDEGIVVERADVDRALDRVAAQNHMKRSELARAVRAAGMTDDEYRGEIRRQLVETRLLYLVMNRDGVRFDGKDDKEQQSIREREHKRWMAELRRHASIQQYFRP